VMQPGVEESPIRDPSDALRWLLWDNDPT
jgi:hypothetical protein